MIRVTHFTDPGCPWAYSAWPAHATLQWRYGEQLRWTLAMIADDPLDVLNAFPFALATAEVPAVMAEHLAEPDLGAAEAGLVAPPARAAPSECRSATARSGGWASAERLRSAWHSRRRPRAGARVMEILAGSLL